MRKEIIFVILAVLLLTLTSCGQAIRKSESAQAIQKFQVDIDKIGKKMGAVLLELEQDSNQLGQGTISIQEMIQRLDKKISKLKTYQQELNKITPPPVYQEGYNYISTAIQKTISALELMKTGIINEDINQINTVAAMLTEVGEDVTMARTSLATATQQVMPGGVSPKSAVKPMSLEEYKTFMRNMDDTISGTLQMIDTSLNQYKQKAITQQDFAYVLGEALTTMQSVENAFITAMPPQQFSKGNVLIAQGVSFLKDGTAMMKQAVEQSNDEIYKQSVQKFTTGIQKIQEGNAELKKAL
ncbi:hypothetical protein JW851_03995 [Candidatus Woesearchaeota archaeon]|nr:hypothetical protein [Candidatus Woesearchaeota archaeon]